jgi:biopolymer transport protein ExbB
MSDLLFLFQTPVAADSVASAASTATFSIYEITMNSGKIGIAIVVTQLILSMIALYIFVERYLTIKRAGKVDDNFINNIRSSVQSGNIQAAKSLCANTDTPVARMVEKGLQRIGKPMDDIRVAIENTGNLEVYKLERNLSILATVSGAAPMIGFLGTVTGMILSFFTMAQNTTGVINPATLASGIYQALITTAFGLVIGIFAYVGFNSLSTYIQSVVFKMEATTVEFLDLLQEPA